LPLDLAMDLIRNGSLIHSITILILNANLLMKILSSFLLGGHLLRLLLLLLAHTVLLLLLKIVVRELIGFSGLVLMVVVVLGFARTLGRLLWVAVHERGVLGFKLLTIKIKKNWGGNRRHTYSCQSQGLPLAQSHLRHSSHCSALR
jgi:hypothetical protein